MSMSSAVDGEHPFSVVTLNVNKLSNDLNNTDKPTAIARIIKNARPHVVVLSETVSGDYNVLSSPASGMNQSTGVALYVDKGIHAVKVAIKDRL
ncbi:hypothetical protein A1Q2_00811 [Trichosporon asahii var. asahii CBS 8904]|uniref:Endonuclease/exonuclease/phosphatase domain-containing protein n=1 Tax=Trichosporon asahii var. asahii (strain CBS 8904) TaxID=1220162 RepID=K1VL13_TRIAC|nr:hypothetical protein A1Q2_00811 [Trichosporon asahii var. asahii CBS 8904]